MKYYFFILSFCMLSCFASKDKGSIAGEYYSKSFGYWGQAMNYLKKYSGSLDYVYMELKPDSSFIYRNCAQESQGRWTLKDDSLYLYCESRKFILDSANRMPQYSGGTKCWEGAEVFGIQKSTLNQAIKMKNGKKYLLCLEKKKAK